MDSEQERKLDAICRIGRKLGQDYDSYQDIVRQRQLAWSARSKGGAPDSFVSAYVQIANQLRFPDKHRTLYRLTTDIDEIIKVAGRFIAQKKLAEAAGESEFHVGMLVLRCTAGFNWIQGKVEKLHPNGKFTFRPYGRGAITADPCNKVTVEVKL